MSGERGGRSVAEWTTFAGACLVLLVVITLILVQMREPRTPSAPAAATTGETREIDGRHHVGVLVTNTGTKTAADVRVGAELEIDGETTTADQTIDFLAGGEEIDLVFVFADDPTAGELTVEVTGFAVP